MMNPSQPKKQYKPPKVKTQAPAESSAVLLGCTNQADCWGTGECCAPSEILCTDYGC